MIIFTYFSHYLAVWLTVSYIKSIYVSKVFIYNQLILEGIAANWMIYWVYFCCLFVCD